jgi:predicted DNA-binding transcriptional regulator AlpA
MKQDTHSPERTKPALISAGELADLLQISTRTLWRLRSAGKLVEPIKLGGSPRWRLEEVQQWIAAGCPVPDIQHTALPVPTLRRGSSNRR